MTDEHHHISSAFDRDLEHLQADVMRMGGMVTAAIGEAVKALTSRDLELAETVRKSDSAIDDLEEEINQECAKIIALRAPVGRDLRTVLTMMRITANLERIGDYAKNIGKRTAALVDVPLINGTDSSLKMMTREVQQMLSDTLDALIANDVEAAKQVRERDLDVDNMYNALFREFLTFMMEDPRNITPCMHLHFIAKNIERMGDLVTNMAEQVIYMSTGEQPDEDREKADNTAFLADPDGA